MYRVMSYNIEYMRRMFHKNKILAEQQQRAMAVAMTIREISPHIMGIVEASDRIGDHEHFLTLEPLKDLGFQMARSYHRRSRQDLVFYYRAPFELISLDSHNEYYNPWLEDIDEDTIVEHFAFERKPLEALFRDTQTETQLLVMLVAFKSKGVFSTSDIHRYEYLALANRKKLYAQSKKVRRRIEQILREKSELSCIVMGDLNDEPGMDHFQRLVGASAVETIMGDIHCPQEILHNTLWHYVEKGDSKKLWTTEFPDPIVANRRHHRAWLDHIFVSPNMLKRNNPIQLISDSGTIAKRTATTTIASDHVPVYCDIQINSCP